MALCTAQYTLHPFLHFPALALWYRRLNRDSSEVLRGPDSFFLCQSHLRSENKFFNVKRLNISVKHISKVVIIVPLDADFFKLAFYLSTIYKVDRRGSACVTSRRNSLKKTYLVLFSYARDCCIPLMRQLPLLLCYVLATRRKFSFSIRMVLTDN